MRRRARDRVSAAPVARRAPVRPSRPATSPLGGSLEQALEAIADDRRIELVTALFLISIVEKCVEATNREQTLTQATMLDLLRLIKRLVGDAEAGLQLRNLRKALSKLGAESIARGRRQRGT